MEQACVIEIHKAQGIRHGKGATDDVNGEHPENRVLQPFRVQKPLDQFHLIQNLIVGGDFIKHAFII